MKVKDRFLELAGKDVEEVWDSPVSGTTVAESLRIFLSGKKEDVAFVGLTIGDLIYDALRVDPTVLEAMDFARTEDLSNIFNFAYFANRIENLEGRAYTGNISQLQGYVAERLIAQRLQSQGMEVEFAESPNQEGFDLLVNGEPFQVKCVENPSEVLEHLERYPDIPILVNEDLAEKLQEYNNVYPVPGIRHDEIVEATESNLEAGDEILDFEIPLITVVITSGRNAYAMLEGRTDFISALKNVTIDTSGRIVGGVIGSEALALVGCLFGPAGGVIGGLAGGVLGFNRGRILSDWAKDMLLCRNEKSALEETLKELLKTSTKVVQKNIEILKAKQLVFRQSLEGKEKIKSILWQRFKFRLEEELKYHTNKLKQIIEAASNPYFLDEDILVAAEEGSFLIAQAGTHPHAVQKEYNSLARAIDRLLKKRKKHLL